MPKLDVPTFDGEILNWQKFWDQFVVAVHERKNVSNAEKLLYLEQALKGGSAAKEIEGLSRTGTHYEEAVKHLKERYHKPRLVFRERVRNLLNLHPVKDGSGRELRRFCEVAQQNLRAINSMGMEDYHSFITALLELKLDPDTMFSWQNESKAHVEKAPQFIEFLGFVDDRAQAAESSSSSRRPSAATGPQNRKQNVGNHPTKPLLSFTVSTKDSMAHNCVLCSSQVHPLRSCTKFMSQSVDERYSTVKFHRLCFNCLRSGHQLVECSSTYRCRRCYGNHHTLLHRDSIRDASASAPPARGDASSQPAAPVDGTRIVSNTAVTLQSSTLLMTSQVIVSSPSGTAVQARALLDTGSAASFISERLVTSLTLPRARQTIRISEIAGSTLSSQAHSAVNFSVSSIQQPDQKIDLTAVVLPKLTHDLPVSPVIYQDSWQHLQGIQLADPQFGQQGE